MGKSTLFNALSNAKAQAANFPFCTIEPNVGVITVPDDRLIQLEKLVKPQRVVPTTVEIVDIAGLVKGRPARAKDSVTSSSAISAAQMRSFTCCAAFEDDNVIHVDGSVNPVRDKEIIDIELQLKDLDTVEKKISKTEKLVRTNEKDAARAMEILLALKKHLEQGQNARAFQVSDEDREKHVNDMFLLTVKPVIYVCNVDEKSVVNGNAHTKAIQEIVKDESAGILFISAAIESEIATLEDF